MTRKQDTFTVRANNPNPTNTQLRFRKDAKINIVSRGTINIGGHHIHAGPVGRTYVPPRELPETYGWKRLYPSQNYGALMALCGSEVKAIGGGLLNWSMRTPDPLRLHINDAEPLYNDNDGFFEVDVEYDTSDLYA